MRVSTIPPRSITTFDSTVENLQDLLRSVYEGKTQLPDFQRGWVWDDFHIRSLLASVSLSYPIGTVMMLQTGNPDVRFIPRPVEGVTLSQPREPERLILDGQQRLTSLFQALALGQPVLTRDARGKPIRRWYYLDMQKALDPDADRDEAVVALPDDKVVRNFRGEVAADCSTPQKEYEAGLFPLSRILDYTAWRRGYNAHFRHNGARLDQFDHFEMLVIEAIKGYQVPLTMLRKETRKEAVCQVFEKVNTGGVSLNVFELLTATFAASDCRLRDDWAARETRLRQRKVLRLMGNTEFLQALTLLATHDRRSQALAQGTSLENAPGVTCKRRDILRLTLGEYRNWADPLTDAFERAAMFLNALRTTMPVICPTTPNSRPLPPFWPRWAIAPTTTGCGRKSAVGIGAASSANCTAEALSRVLPRTSRRCWAGSRADRSRQRLLTPISPPADC
jgi:hypothetical protein